MACAAGSLESFLRAYHSRVIFKIEHDEECDYVRLVLFIVFKVFFFGFFAWRRRFILIPLACLGCCKIVNIFVENVAIIGHNL